MRRRLFAAGIVTAAARLFAAWAQDNRLVKRIGLVFPGPRGGTAIVADLIASGVRETAPSLSQIEMVMRFAEDDPARIEPVVAEVIGRNVSVFIAAGACRLRAARQASSTLPMSEAVRKAKQR